MFCARLAILTGVLTLPLAGARAAAPTPEVAREQEEFFETHVRPVLADNCFSCHGQEKQKSGLRLDSREAIMRGSASTAVIVPGDAGRSPLIKAVRYEGDVHMPPAGKLPDAAIEALSQWVQMGAPWPATDRPPQGAAAAQTQPAADADIERARGKHWAFRPVQDPPVPPVRNEAWCSGDIDRFIVAKLEEKGMLPSPRADRRTLIRRATFDLHGLPPTPDEIDDFLHDPSSDTEAFAKVIDRLLASPRYGERWGRHWLDVARYADTKGYVFQEERRFPYSWTYRDFVIRAFNEDLPYDQFIVYQLAADLLTLEDDPRPLAAMGYLTLGRRFINNVHDIIDDRIDVVSRGLLGLTVSCARCHDHKYDPIPTADYYSLYGVFASSTEPIEKPLIGKPADNAAYRKYVKDLAAKKAKLDDFTRTHHDALLQTLRSQAGDYLARTLVADADSGGGMILGRDDLRPAIVQRWKAYLAQAAQKHEPVFTPWHALAALKPEEFAAQAPPLLAELAFRPPQGTDRVNWPVLARLLETMPVSMTQVARVYGQILSEIDRKWHTAWAASTQPAGGGKPIEALSDPQDEELRQVLYAAGSPTALTMEESPRHFDNAARLKHRELRKEIEVFQANSADAPPAAMTLAESTLHDPRIFVRGNPNNPGKPVPRRFLAVLSPPDRRPFEKGSGRLELARAIASRDNPLTARVLVNRVWMHHFGEGLVRTPSDFGTRGEPPTHPELLDHLASRFMQDGWSIRKLHRRILMSNVYQQRSDDDGRNAQLDPENRWLSRMNRRRLDFESMRDALLAVAGRLDLTMGGPSVDITAPPFPPRRSVYGFIDRQNLPPVLRMFDFASPDASNAQRHHTTVPQQALFLMNSPFVVQQARHTMQRTDILQETAADAKIRQLYRIAFGRRPSERELVIARSFLEAGSLDLGGPPPKPVVWQYGYGKYDPASATLQTFTPLTRFENQTYGGNRPEPDPELGWVRLSAEGGHPGDESHQAIRRWVAPVSGTISIQGVLRHRPAPQKCGNGLQAWIVSSRAGRLGHYLAEHGETPTPVETQVEKGDTIDFIVDARGDVSCDSFQWAPVLRRTGPSTPEESGSMEWGAKTDFAPPPPPPEQPLTPWQQYAQVLLLTNEFVFVD